jgi:hypothetical protein
MAIIVVGGSNRGVGKTALVCGLIAATPEYRWNAVKITTHDHEQTVSADGPQTFQGAAPHLPHVQRMSTFRQFWERTTGTRAEKPRPVPVAPGGPIWEDTTPGEDTDTARYLAAGAQRALLVSAPDGELAEPLNQLWPRFGRGTNLIFESNSVVHHVRADACLLIHGVAERTLPLPERKPSFIAALRHADAMVAHGRIDKVIPDGLCLAGAEPETTAAKPIFHLAALERVSPELLAWVRRALDPFLRS